MPTLANRRKKIGEDVKRRVVEEYKGGIVVREIAQKYQISKATIYRWLQLAAHKQNAKN